MTRISIGLSLTLLACSAAGFVPSAHAQDPEHDLQKSYAVSGKPRLELEADDSGIEVHSCGACRAIQIHVHADRKLSTYRLEEHQDGDHIVFKLKSPHDWNSDHVHIGFSMSKGAKITVETPAALTLDAKVADGSLAATGLNGEISLRSSDGSVQASDVHGQLRFSTSDGSVTAHHASGEIEARSSDGSLDIDGQFSRLILHTSDGSVKLALAEGSKLMAASDIGSSDGTITLRLPQTLDADLNLSAADGHIHCTLPLRTDSYDTGDSAAHHLAGHLNAGGTALQVRTADGSINITPI